MAPLSTATSSFTSPDKSMNAAASVISDTSSYFSGTVSSRTVAGFVKSAVACLVATPSSKCSSSHLEQ